MNEKKVMVLIFGLVVLVALMGLVLFYQSEKTGGFNIRMPMKSGKAVKITPVKVSRDRIITSREPKEDVTQQKIKITKDFVKNACLWADTGMLFHISSGAAKHLDFNPDQVGKYDYFSKSDLEFAVKPDFYDANNIYVKGGTVETYNAGARACIKSYKGQKIIPQAGLSCIENRWWLIANICPLGSAVEGPPMPD